MTHSLSPTIPIVCFILQSNNLPLIVPTPHNILAAALSSPPSPDMTSTRVKRQSDNAASELTKRQRAGSVPTKDTSTAATLAPSSTLSASPSSSSLPSAHTSLSPSPSTVLFSKPVALTPSLAVGWSELPIALFDRICSYPCSPVYDTLLSLSTVCRQWRQRLNGDASGRFDSWRHVPSLNLLTSDDCLFVGNDRRRVERGNWESALRSVRRVRLLSIHLTSDSGAGLQMRIDLLDLLFQPAASSSTETSSRLLLDELTIRTVWWMVSKKDSERVGSAISRCLLRCPPLRFATLYLTEVPALTAAALRHLVGSSRLLHLELDALQLSTMLWDGASKRTLAWEGATTLQSLNIQALHPRKPQVPLQALRRALPSLTHLHLPELITHDTLQCIGQHLGDRLSYLGVSLPHPIPPRVAVLLTALQSLHITIHPARNAAMSPWSLDLLPQLSDLTIIDERDADDAAMTLPPLPATLTYLQMMCHSGLVVPLSSDRTTDSIELHTALPPSLLCLSLELPITALSDSLLSSLPTRCPLLTHCHIAIDDGSEVEVDEDTYAVWEEGMQALREQLGTTVWCQSVYDVEQQRLNRRWQQEMMGSTALRCG